MNNTEVLQAIDAVYRNSSVHRRRYLDFLKEYINPTELQAPIFHFKMQLPSVVQDILKALQNQGITALIVGGSIRDTILRDTIPGINIKDFDIEVYALSPEELGEILKKFGPVNIIGMRFGVIKLQYQNLELDFAVAREDNKQGKGKTGFNISFNSSIMPDKACSRRDFTINAMAYDPEFGVLLDFFGGLNDLENKIIKATSSQFEEDPTRVYRAIQFTCRFGLTLDSNTAERCLILLKEEHSSIYPEMIWEEWKKFLLKGKEFSKGFQSLQESGLDKFYPQITNLRGCQQDPKHHPEGDVWTHTVMVLQAMSSICDREKITGEDKLTLMLAAICHDFGKPATTQFLEGRFRALGHCQAGIEPTKAFLKTINCPEGIGEKVLKLVEAHLDHASFNGSDPSRAALARLKDKIFPASIKELTLLVEADQSGRHPLPSSSPISHYVKLEGEYGLSQLKFKPLIGGEDLKRLGYKQGRDLGRILSFVKEIELSGNFFNTYEEGINWLKKEHEKGTFKCLNNE